MSHDPVEPTPITSQLLTCSAKGCRNTAVFALVWRNPKLHDTARRKTWLACADHRDSLAEFLGARGFLLSVDQLDSPV